MEADKVLHPAAATECKFDGINMTNWNGTCDQHQNDRAAQLNFHLSVHDKDSEL